MNIFGDWPTGERNSALRLWKFIAWHRIFRKIQWYSLASWVALKKWVWISQMLHVWHIYLHVVDFWGKCRYIFHSWSVWIYGRSPYDQLISAVQKEVASKVPFCFVSKSAGPKFDENMSYSNCHWYTDAYNVRPPFDSVQFISPITMVYGIYNELVTGANLNQLITGGPHIVLYTHSPFSDRLTCHPSVFQDPKVELCYKKIGHILRRYSLT